MNASGPFYAIHDGTLDPLMPSIHVCMYYLSVTEATCDIESFWVNSIQSETITTNAQQTPNLYYEIQCIAQFNTQ